MLETAITFQSFIICILVVPASVRSFKTNRFDAEAQAPEMLAAISRITALWLALGRWNENMSKGSNFRIIALKFLRIIICILVSRNY